RRRTDGPQRGAHHDRRHHHLGGSRGVAAAVHRQVAGTTSHVVVMDVPRRTGSGPDRLGVLPAPTQRIANASRATQRLTGPPVTGSIRSLASSTRTLRNLPAPSSTNPVASVEQSSAVVIGR